MRVDNNRKKMDKKTIIGLVLMVAVFVGYSFYMTSEQQKTHEMQVEYEKAQQELKEKREKAAADEQARIDALTPEARAQEEANKAAAAHQAKVDKHGEALLERIKQNGEVVTVSNDFMTVGFDPVGGKIVSAVLNDYTRYADEERTELVNIVNPGSAYFGIELKHNSDAVDTNAYSFDCSGPVTSEDGKTTTVTMTLPLDNKDEMDETHAEIKYVYTINHTGDPTKDYLIGFDLYQKNIDDYLSHNNEIILFWKNQSMHNERSFTNESMASNIIYYEHDEEASDELSLTGERETYNNLDWVAHKQQYFNSTLIAKSAVHADMGFTTSEANGEDFVKAFDTRVIIPHTSGKEHYEFAFYYGPNDYNILSEVTYNDKNYHLDEIIPMGGWFVGWINRYLTIPIFNWLNDNGVGFGLIILILTLIVKIIILPLTYKSYMSTAKMRAIRPEMEEINKKYPNKEDAMKKQQALMELYRKAGVSPMGGCLPLLIQMPILWAMFRFFPASIELRGEGFLWANDLSSYDSIIELPFSIPFYGDHVSLFALLMAISLFGYSYMSYKQQAATTAGQPGGSVMKFMMVYFMPVMMLFFFNSYSSGLCYYYFLSQMMTMLIMYIIRRSVNDEKVRARLLANASKPRKKSKFQERYEAMLQQEQINREQRRQRK